MRKRIRALGIRLISSSVVLMVLEPLYIVLYLLVCMLLESLGIKFGVFTFLLGVFGIIIPVIGVNHLLNRWVYASPNETMMINIISACVVAIIYRLIGEVFGMGMGKYLEEEYMYYNTRYLLHIASGFFFVSIAINSILGRIIQMCLRSSNGDGKA